MEKFGLVFILIALMVVMPVLRVASGNKIILEFFYHPDCSPCRKPKQLLEDFENEYDNYIKIEWQNMKNIEPRKLFFEKYKLTRRPVIVFNKDPSTALYNITKKNIKHKIDQYINITDKKEYNNENSYQLITLSAVIIAGLMDGINPCAFSLLIFFLSFIFSIKKSRKNVFILGTLYIVGVYLGYISLGVGIIHTINIFGIMHPISIIGILFLIITGFLQIRDAITLEKPIMKFPNFAVPFFRKLTNKVTHPIAILLGFIVSLLEFPCSGGIYIGILLLIAKSKIKGLFYLLIYNITFVIPLIIILLLASNTDVLFKMNEWRVINRRKLKLISGISLLILALLTWYFVLYKS